MFSSIFGNYDGRETMLTLYAILHLDFNHFVQKGCERFLLMELVPTPGLFGGPEISPPRMVSRWAIGFFSGWR